jgi:glycosyltransferase involved in cell wall biosynthesis
LVPEIVFAIPGDLATPTGGYRYDRRVIELLPEFGWNVRHLALPGDYPAPSRRSLVETERLFAATPSDALLLIDGLAFGAMPSELIDRAHRKIVALVHHPLALETGLKPERAEALLRSERAALARTTHVIATSSSTVALLVHDFDVPVDRVSVAEPGTDCAPRARGSDGPPRLLSVGAVTMRKGYDTLIAALALIADLAWESRIAGSLDRDPDAAAALSAAIGRAGLDRRVRLLGSLDEQALAAEYDRARLFVLPSHFEGYGMAFAEALARGLPVVGCAGSAVSATVPAETGILVPPGDAQALAEALRQLLADPSELARRSEAAWKHSQHLPRWRDTAAKFAQALAQAHAGAFA